MINQHKYRYTDPESSLETLYEKASTESSLDFKSDFRVKILGKDVCESGLSLRFVILGHVDVGKSI